MDCQPSSSGSRSCTNSVCESEDAREQRLARRRDRDRNRRASESEEAREQRLARRRETDRNRRASEREEAREQRLARDRARRRDNLVSGRRSCTNSVCESEDAREQRLVQKLLVFRACSRTQHAFHVILKSLSCKIQWLNALNVQ